MAIIDSFEIWKAPIQAYIPLRAFVLSVLKRRLQLRLLIVFDQVPQFGVYRIMVILNPPLVNRRTLNDGDAFVTNRKNAIGNKVIEECDS